MQVAYKLEPGDCWYFYRDRFLHDPATMARWLLWFLVPIFAISYALWLCLSSDLMLAGVITIVFAVFWIVKMARMIRRLYVAAATNGIGMQQTVLGIDSTGLRFRGATIDTWMSWKGISEVNQNDRHIYLFYAGKSAWIVPKRNFSDTQGAVAFYDAALGYWNQSRSSEPQIPVHWDEEAGALDEPLDQISYEFTSQHYVEFALRFRRKDNRGKRLYAQVYGYILILMGLICLWGSYHAAVARESYSSVLLLLGLGMAALGAYYLWIWTWLSVRRTALKVIAHNPQAVGQRTIILRSRSLESRSPLSFRRTGWSRIAKIEDTGEYILIYEPCGAVIIPVSAFKSAGAALNFYHAARTYHMQATSSVLAGETKEGVWPPAPTARG